MYGAWIVFLVDGIRSTIQNGGNDKAILFSIFVLFFWSRERGHSCVTFHLYYRLFLYRYFFLLFFVSTTYRKKKLWLLGNISNGSLSQDKSQGKKSDRKESSLFLEDCVSFSRPTSFSLFFFVRHFVSKKIPTGFVCIYTRWRCFWEKEMMSRSNWVCTVSYYLSGLISWQLNGQEKFPGCFHLSNGKWNWNYEMEIFFTKR